MAYLRIERVAERHFGNYTLRAGNWVGSAVATVRLARGAVADKSSSMSGDARGVRQQQRDAHAVSADSADRFHSYQQPSAAVSHRHR